MRSSAGGGLETKNKNVWGGGAFAKKNGEVSAKKIKCVGWASGISNGIALRCRNKYLTGVKVELYELGSV